MGIRVFIYDSNNEEDAPWVRKMAKKWEAEGHTIYKVQLPEYTGSKVKYIKTISLLLEAEGIAQNTVEEILLISHGVPGEADICTGSVPLGTSCSIGGNDGNTNAAEVEKYLGFFLEPAGQLTILSCEVLKKAKDGNTPGQVFCTNVANYGYTVVGLSGLLALNSEGATAYAATNGDVTEFIANTPPIPVRTITMPDGYKKFPVGPLAHPPH